ncbi:recombinase family protein [Nonomuraea sp. NPDC003707]
MEAFECPTCGAPAGSACRTRGGKVAPKYHTPRFMLVPQLRAELEVRTPVDRGPGRAWAAGPERQATAADIAAGAKPTRVGYARCSTAQQELQSQLDALHQAGCEPIFSEKISTRVKVRPEFTKAMDFARTIKTAVPHQRVIVTVHEMKRLGRGAAELPTIAEQLRRADIQLELLTGPLQGVYDPSGHGAALFAFFAGMAESEREYIGERSLEGQPSARERRRHGGRPKVFDDDMIAYARTPRARGVAVPDIAAKLVIPTSKNKCAHPSVASVYRILAEETGQEGKRHRPAQPMSRWPG